MARVLRLKLQAFYYPHLFSSPALAYKVLDARHISWKCYTGSALLERSCSSIPNADDIDGDNKAANGVGDSARKGKGIGDQELDLDKLTNSICNKLWAKANVARGEKDKGFQEDSVLTKENKKADKNDIWQQVVSTVRTMVVKNKTKAVSGVNSGLPKREENEDTQDFSDLEFLEDRDALSGGLNGSNKDSLVTNAFGNKFKQKMSQSQFLHQQMSKDTKPFSLFKSLDDSTPLSSILSTVEDTSTTRREISNNKIANFSTETYYSSEDFFPALKPSNSRDTNQMRSKDVTPGGVHVKMSKGKDPALSAEDGSRAGIYDFKANPSYASEFPSRLSHHDNTIPHTGYMVCVQNLPSSCNPGLIKATMTTMHGEVLGLYKKAVRNDVYNVYVQFKTADSMEAAIAARKLQVGGRSFSITRSDQVFSTVVRISKVNMDTTVNQLTEICGKFGSVDNIRKRINGVYDVCYQVKELPNMTRILGRLNEVSLNRATWIASPAPSLHPSVQRDVLKSPEGQAWHNIQVNVALNRIESGIDGVFVLFEDLKELTELRKGFSK